MIRFGGLLSSTDIKTPDGTTKINKLSVGDKILSPTGKSLTVTWLGKKRLFPKNEDALLYIPRNTVGNTEGIVLTSPTVIQLNKIAVEADYLIGYKQVYREILPYRSRPELYHLVTEPYLPFVANGFIVLPANSTDISLYDKNGPRLSVIHGLLSLPLEMFHKVSLHSHKIRKSLRIE